MNIYKKILSAAWFIAGYPGYPIESSANDTECIEPQYLNIYLNSCNVMIVQINVLILRTRHVRHQQTCI